MLIVSSKLGFQSMQAGSQPSEETSSGIRLIFERGDD
jgi:hypothetical protein